MLTQEQVRFTARQQERESHGEGTSGRPTHLVCLRVLVEDAGVDGCSHQVVGGGDGVDVPGEMEVELRASVQPLKYMTCITQVLLAFLNHADYQSPKEGCLC